VFGVLGIDPVAVPKDAQGCDELHGRHHLAPQDLE
jgi:hypothetical protein